MLPSCGHFKNIPCPFYKLALCVRPHCPYKHQSADNGHARQTLPSLADEAESLFDSKVNINVAQKGTYDQTITVKQENITYIPTPVESNSKPPGILKSSISNFDKPSSSYVPEYKPTPISKLKECTPIIVKSNKSEYSPEFPTAVRRKKNVEEYDPTEVKCIPKKTVTFVDCSNSGDSDVPIVLISSSDEELDDPDNTPKFSDDDSEEELSSTPKSKIQEESKVSQDTKKDLQDDDDEIEVIEINEFSVVDKILVDSKKNEMLLKAKVNNSNLSLKINDGVSKVISLQKNDKSKTVSLEKTEVKDKKCDNSVNVKSEKFSSSLTVSKADCENSKSEFKEKSEHNLNIIEKFKKDDNKKVIKSDREKNRTDKTDKCKYRNQKHDNSHSVHREKLKKDSKELSDKSKHSKKVSIEAKKIHSSDIKNSKHSTRTVIERSSDRTIKKRATDDPKVKQNKSSNGPTVKKNKYFEDSQTVSSSESSKLKEKSFSKHSSIKRKSDSDSEHPNSKHKSLSPSRKKPKYDNNLSKIKKLPIASESDAKSKIKSDSYSDDDMPLNSDVLSSCSDSDPDEECRRIFNECYPETSELPKEEKKNEKSQAKATDLVILRKKRFAHPAASDLKKPASSQKKVDMKRPLNPAQVMFDRFAQCQAKLTKQNENKDDFSAKSIDKKRLNFVPNHSLLAAVKNKMNQSNTTLSKFSPLPPTVTKTLKVTQRIAHIPEAALKPRPIIPADFGSKVPSNIRQKFLNAFIDECLKFSQSENEAYDLAIEEEKKSYDRSSSKSLYMNVAANTLKRLRNQAKEGPKVNDNASSKDISKKLEKRTVSHEALLNGPLAQRRSFSIGPKKQAFDIKDLGGIALYEHLLAYILTPEQLKENGFPQPHPVEKDRAIIEGVYANRAVYCNDEFKRVCCRCQKTYFVNVDGDYVRDEECDFHWGRLWKKKIAGSLESRYSCCQGDSESDGCSVSTGHVFEGSEAHALRGFVKTLPKTPPQDNFYGIYSLDCEMCYTTAGMELTRVTVIDTDLKSVYESFVKPQHQVLDYNTRFSGITEDDLKDVRTTILDVQAVLLCIFNSKTILIGHSLESDFKALKIFHSTTVDTSVVFPHKNGLPFKRALRTLMAEKLNKIIQNDIGGHDSHEDAAACMELMLWKIKEDIKGNR